MKRNFYRSELRQKRIENYNQDIELTPALSGPVITEHKVIANEEAQQMRNSQSMINPDTLNIKETFATSSEIDIYGATFQTR